MSPSNTTNANPTTEGPLKPSTAALPPASAKHENGAFLTDPNNPDEKIPIHPMYAAAMAAKNDEEPRSRATKICIYVFSIALFAIIVVGITMMSLPTKLDAMSRERAHCTPYSHVELTFYGYPDNDPPSSANIMHDCGRGNQAGGLGTYDNPLTFATAPGEFDNCEIIYSPYLRKYLINEDYCEKCKSDWSRHRRHIDIWLDPGNATSTSNSTSTSTSRLAWDQMECEKKLTPDFTTIIRVPNKDLPVDVSRYFNPGEKETCNMHSVYKQYTVEDYCKV